MRHTWDRLKAFVVRASIVIVPMVMVLNILNSTGIDGTFGHEDSQDSVLSAIGKTIAPAFKPMGVTEENWPAAVGIFTGLLAKEAVVGTLNALYTQAGASGAEVSRDGEPDAKEGYSFRNDLIASFASISEKLSGLKDTILDPFGLAVLDEKDESITSTTYLTMKTMFPSTAAAFAYLLLVLLYFPCVAVVGAIARESSVRWAAFVALWSTGLAYCVSTLFYQFATFSEHPVYSASWMIGILIFGAAVFFIMRQIGQASTQNLSTLSRKLATT